MGKLSSLLWGAAIGAGFMYFYDPQNGNRRKAMLRDQLYRVRSRGNDAIDMAVNDLRNRTRGVLAEGMAIVSPEGHIPDYLVEERARARMGFLTRHPRAVEIRAENGTLRLSGDILADEADALVKGLGKIRGVKNVENNLRAHQDASNVPQLQGEGWMPGQYGSQWSPAARLLAGGGAAYLLLYSIFKGGFTGLLARGAALYFGTRALTNMNARELTGASPEGAIRVRKGITINAPVDEVYNLWSNFENFQRFMNNIESIRDTGDNRSHWVVKGPAGSKVEFDAITTEDIRNEVLAWETTPDSTVKHQGQVRFRELGGGRTQVNVNMAYTPPAGVAGHAVAALFGKDPKSEMDADLARMKSLLEQGKTTSDSRKVTRDEVTGQRAGVPVTGQGGKSGKGRRSERRDDMEPISGMGEMGDMGGEDMDDNPNPLAPTDL